jgi:RHS repeat-associated protein
MGNMICRNTDTTTSHTCAGSSPTGALLSYDNEGHLVSWSSPTGSANSSSDQFLYDAEGNRVLQRASSTTRSTTTVSDTITFDSYTETTITNGTTTTIKYYTAGGRTVAMANGTSWYGLATDLLGNVTLAVNGQGHVVSAQLYTPYGSTSYSNGTMPTTYNYTGQRLDGVTGLLYYNARYYDPVSGRFVSADTVQGNGQGMDPYGYVGGNPETSTDPTGHWGINWGSVITIAVVAVVVAVVVLTVLAAPEIVPIFIGAAAEEGAFLEDDAIKVADDTTTETTNVANAASNSTNTATTVANDATNTGTTVANDATDTGTTVANDATNTSTTVANDTTPSPSATPFGGGSGGSASGSGSLTESGIKDTLNNAGANVMESDNPSLPWNDNRIYLGHYGGQGTIWNGVDIPSVGKPGLRFLETLAQDNGGKELQDLPGTIDAMQPEIENAGEILFNIGRSGIKPGSLTAQEFQFIMGNPSFLQKTIFLFGATY